MGESNLPPNCNTYEWSSHEFICSSTSLRWSPSSLVVLTCLLTWITPIHFFLDMYHRTWCSLVDDCTCSVMTRATWNVGKGLNWNLPQIMNPTAHVWPGSILQEHEQDTQRWLYEYKSFLFIIRKFTMPRHGIFRNPQTVEFRSSSLLCIWYSLWTSPASDCCVHTKRDKKHTPNFQCTLTRLLTERLFIYCY